VTLSSLMGDEGVEPPPPAFGALHHASWTLPWLEGDKSFGDIGVVNDVNQNTYNQGVALAAAQLAQYVAVPPAALPSRAYAGPPHAAAPSARDLVLVGEAYEAEVWALDAAPPAGAHARRCGPGLPRQHRAARGRLRRVRARRPGRWRRALPAARRARGAVARDRRVRMKG
jgi:hypothetical protein